MRNIFIDILPPWVETGLQPAFYDLESGTVLQQTARMYAKVRELTEAYNTFTENIVNEVTTFEHNTNDEIERFENATNDEIERFENATNDEIKRFEGVINDTVEEYIQKFNDLHDYVQDYFDNLDVQKEINNKLDAMVEDGTMAEILEGTIFPTIIEMIGDTTNPIHYGADPTGTKDSTQAINDCIDANKGGTVQFTQGVYKVTGQILLPFAQDKKVSIYGNGATIKASGEIQYLFFVGYDKVSGQNDVGFKSCIKDLYIDGTDADIEYAVYNVKGYKDLHLDNVNIYRCQNGILIGEETGNPADVLWTDSIIYGKGSEYEGTGVISNCSDNYFSNLRIYGFRVGFEINSYVTIETTHVLLRWAEQTSVNFDPYPVGSEIFNGYYEQTMFAKVNDSCKMIACYSDSTYKFLNITTNGYVILVDSFYYNARTGIDQHIIDCEKQDTKLTVANCEFSLKPATNTSIIRCTHANGIFSGYAQLSFSGIEIQGIANLTNFYDYALVGYEVKTHANISGNANDWYIIGVINNIANNTTGDISIFINSWEYSSKFEVNTSNETARITQYGSSDTATSYTIGVIYDTIKHIAYICFKSSNNFAGLKAQMKVNYTNNLTFAVEPVKEDSVFNSTRKLSDYSELTPTQTLVLNGATNIRTSR